MTRFWSFFIHKRSFTLFLIGVLTLGGLYAMLSIPKESTPDISIPLGIVVTALPGASASDVERLVTDKIESGVLGVENVSKVTSTSGNGISTVSVEFDSSADIDKSIQSLKDAVDTVQLPEEATDPSVSDVNFADSPVLIISISGDLAPGELTALGEDVSEEVKRVQGVSKVAVSGVRAREVQVIAHEDKLRQFNLSLGDVTNAIRSAGVASPAGTITVDGVNYSVRFESSIPTTDKVRDIVINIPGGNATVRLADVAEVIDGLEDPSTYSRVSVEGQPAQPSLTLTVFKSRGGNIVQTGHAVEDKLTELQSGILANTETVISYNAAEEVNKSLIELSRVGIETVILVTLILYLTLGLRESLVAAASIPLSFLIAFIGLLVSGNTINNISLFSLILAIGILVDSGVVVVEAYHTRLQKYGNKEKAAIASIREYAWPLIAGTFTTIAVFVPLMFLSGIVGKFLASIPYTVIFVLLASIFVALGIVPLLAIRFIHPNESTSKLAHIQERYNESAKRWYEGFLHRFLADRKGQNRFLWGMIALFVISLLLPSTGLLKSIFFPSESMDYVYVTVEKPQGTAIGETDLSMREVEEVLYQNPDVASFVSETGAGSSFSGGFSGASSGSNIGNITVNLKEDHDITSAEFVEELREQFATITSATITVSEPAGGPPSAAPVTLTFTGDDLNELTATADRAATVLSDIPGVVNVVTDARNGSAEFVVSLDGAKAAQLGVSPLTVADTLRTALFGAEATSIRAGQDDIDVNVKLDLNPNYQDPSQTTHATIDDVRNLTFPGTSGPVPLSSIATVSYVPAQSSIDHEAGDRIETVTADVSAGANAIVVSAEFEERFTEDMLGKGVTMKVGGAAEDVDESFTQLFLALIAGAALMLAILVLEFNSFRLSFYLLSIIPLSLVGVFLGLTVVGQPLSLPSMLGIIALAGVIINHAIILMDSIARIHREQHGLTLEQVVVEAASTRLRPILLTTIVTVIGMIPLAVASPFWAPLAVSIMFGLAFSLLLTLMLIPMLYYRWPGKQVREQFKDAEASAHTITKES